MRRGTKNNVNYAGKCLSIIIVWCMVLSGFAGLLLVNVGTASEVGSSTMAIPQIIDGVDVVIESKPGEPWIYDHDGPLDIINGGSLTLINSTLNFPQDGAYYLDVNTASTLKLINSTITTGANAQATWSPFLDITIDNSDFIMEDYSALVFPGTLDITNSDVYVNDSWITGLSNTFTEDLDFPNWLQNNPTAEQVLSESWYNGYMVDASNDGPIMTFTDCDDVTIAGSRIDMLYENSTFDASAVADLDERFALINTEMTMIDTYISLDWVSSFILTGTPNMWAKNMASLSLDSHIYAYNVTHDLPATYPAFPVGSDSPYLFADTSELYYYKWASMLAVDSNSNPIEDAFVNFTYKFYLNDIPYGDYVYAMNDLSDLSPEDIRILDYMDRVSMYTIDENNYNVTNSDGMVMIPLLSDIHPALDADIDGDHCGEYTVDISYDVASWNTYVDFSPYPMITSDDNTVDAPLVQMMDVTVDLPDLTPGIMIFTPATNIIVEDTIVEINVTIENLGNTNARDVFVQVFDYDGVGAPILIGNTTIDSIPGLGEDYFIFEWSNIMVGGNHTIKVIIDSNYTVTEDDEDNNIRDYYIDVVPKLPELSIEAANIGFSNDNISFDNEITITALVSNDGGRDNGTNVLVSFYEGDPAVDGVFIGSGSIADIAPGAYIETSVNWIPTTNGTYDIYVWVDSNNANDEYNEDNNTAFAQITILPKPNPTLENLVFDDETPMMGDNILITVDLTNEGSEDAIGNISIEFYDYDMDGNPLGQIGTTQVQADLLSGQTVQVNQPWTPGIIDYHQIQVVITCEAKIDEGDLTDNEIFANILVYDGGFQDLIVNDTMPMGFAGNFAISGDYDQDGYVLVEEGGILSIQNADFTMMQERSYQYNIIVKDNGVLNIDSEVVSTNGYYMDIFIMDNAEVNIIDSTTPSNLNLHASDNSNIYIDNSDIGGIFSAPSGAVTLKVENTTFRKALTSFGGDSTADLIALTMTTPIVWAQDNAEIKLYRCIDVTVLDANNWPIENAAVNLEYLVPNYLQALLANNGITDVDGYIQFTTLSDIINQTVHQSSASVSNYRLTSNFVGSTDVFTDVVNIALPSYNVMTLASNNVPVTIKMNDVRPDLDPPFEVSTHSVGKDETVMLSANISNGGDADAYNFFVTFADETNDYILEIIPMAFLERNTYQWVFINYTWTDRADFGNHTVNVTVDWGNFIIEQDEENNYNSTWINVVGRPDLTIEESDISMISSSVVNYEVMIGVTVNNIGDTDITNVSVSIYDSDANGTLIGNVTIDSILFDSSASIVPIIWTPTEVREYNVMVIIDEDNTVIEVNETNNDATRSILINDYSDIYVGQVLFIVNGDAITEVNNRTVVTIRALVNNSGGVANTGIARFYDHYNIEIGSYILPTIYPNGSTIAEITWFADADLDGNSVNRNIDVRVTDIAMGENPGGQSNTRTAVLSIIDTRADLMATSADVNITTEDLIESTAIDVNVTVHNDGADAAQDFTVEIFYDEIDSTHLIGTAIIETLNGNSEMSVIITCAGIPSVGEHYLLIVLDRDILIGDNFTVNGMDYNYTGSVEEYNELNNQLINVTVDIEAAEYLIRINSPSSEQNYTIGEENNTWVSGRLTKVIGGQGVGGAEVVIMLDGERFTATTDMSGNFGTAVDLPGIVGQYTIVASTGNAEDESTIINVNGDTGLDWFLIILIIVLAVVGIIIGVTAYLKFVGLGKTVECGECGAFIPDSATKCPKCNTEFETDTAKCSVCGAWVPINSKTCPECESEFTIGDEELDDYKTQMKKQYDDVINGFKIEAKKELGDTFSEKDFQTWWATQPTFITFDQWLKEDEEMKRLGSKPCPNCATPNSVTATICHKCGTVMEEEEAKPIPAAATTKAPGAEKAPAPVEAAPAPVVAPVAEAPAPGEEEAKKKCPSCGMELGIHEKACPICSYDFEQKSKPPEGGAPPEGAAPQVAKKVVRKPVKKVVRRPVQKGPEGGK